MSTPAERPAVSEQSFRLLVESVKDYGIFMLDPTGRIATWNAGAARIKGYRADEIIGKHFSQFYPPEDLARGKPAYELEVAGKVGRFEDEGWRLRKDGSRFWANVVITAMRDREGTLVGFGKVTRDLTERRRAEEERVRLAQAEEALKLRDTFLSIAAHELRTPLTALQIEAQTLLRRVKRAQDEVEPPPLSAFVPAIGGIDRNVGRATKLVEHLLDVSRIQLGKLRMELDDVDLTEIAREAVERYRDQCLQVGSPLTFTAGAPVVGRWDALKLEQVVTNLVSNALKFGRGKPIHVGVVERDGRARLTVRDRGIGIAPADQGRIFGRFERAVSDRHFGGFGLGLWIVREIAGALGGEVTVQSTPGEGATFTVDLPLAGPPEAGAGEAPAPGAPAT